MADDAPKLEIFGDSPTTEDGLGFDDHADILLGMIGNFDVRSPLTIGIHGRWGSGKTSLMRMLKKRLEDGAGVKTVWFNAWAYGDEPIGLALLQQILIEFQKEEGLKEKGKTLLGNVVKLGTDALSRKTIAMTLEEVKNHFKSSTEIKSTLRQDFEDVIDECLRDRGRLVIFIDDLDRCLPEKTIEILEVVKLFLDVPKCIFVIGVEKGVIERGIEVRYKSKEQELPISGQDYIEKIIQVPFTLPPIREEDMADFIENLGIGGREKGYVKIVAKGTECNPRKVKMFLNVLRIRRAIAERTGEGIEPDLSAKLFVFERGFQEFYRDVVKYKGEDLLCKLERLAKGDSDEKLEGELKNSDLMRKYHEDDDLSSLLRDEPFFCGIDIEPYIYLSGTESSQEIMAYDEFMLDELFCGDYMKMDHAVITINGMPDSEKQRFLKSVISKLKDGAWRVRENAAWALGAIGDARAVEALIDVLEDGDEDESMQGAAARALGHIGDPRAVEALKDALKDEDALVRWNAAEALGEISDVRSVEALMSVLKDVDWRVRENAARALGWIGDARAFEALEEVLEDETASVRESVSCALGAIGGARAVAALEKVLVADDDASVRGNAAGVLGWVGGARAVKALIEALKDMDCHVRENAAEALGGIGGARAVVALEKMLNDDDNVLVRRIVVAALGKLGDARAVEALEKALKDEDFVVRENTSWALKEIKAKQNQ
jgi:HEAT repeat protein